MSAESDILRVFERCGAGALFATELQYGIGPGLEPAAFDATLARLAARGDVLVVAKAAPDPHLAGVDLRIVAPAGPPAAAAIEAAWRDWLREFLASHRCS